MQVPCQLEKESSRLGLGAQDELLSKTWARWSVCVFVAISDLSFPLNCCDCSKRALSDFVKTAYQASPSTIAQERLAVHTDHLQSSSTMASKAFAVVAGVGPGTGAACARRFATSYPVVLLARNPDNYESLVQEINKSGGKAIGISTDVSSEDSVKAAFKKIEEEYKGASCAVAVFNASGRFVRKPLLEMSVDDFSAGYEVSWYVLRSRCRWIEQD